MNYMHTHRRNKNDPTLEVDGFPTPIHKAV